MYTDKLLAEFLWNSNFIEGVEYGLSQYLDDYEDRFTAIKNSYATWNYLNLFDPDSNIYDWHEVIQECHKILMTDIFLLNSEPEDKAKDLRDTQLGVYRTYNVTIEGHRGEEPRFIKRKMAHLFRRFLRATTEAKIWEVHDRFQTIHPFLDGNGRLGRIVLNWLRIKAGLPILVISYSDRFKYYENIKKFRRNKECSSLTAQKQSQQPTELLLNFILNSKMERNLEKIRTWKSGNVN